MAQTCLENNQSDANVQPNTACYIPEPCTARLDSRDDTVDIIAYDAESDILRVLLNHCRVYSQYQQSLKGGRAGLAST